ncbi:MAG: heavy metal sensor histidine kinase [Salinisphaera sp.]|jgi:two-component system heavy metal sensor histidine kinase CusS|nr:heavy metal sensor histidine kinase [Salinisphaera sp.]
MSLNNAEPARQAMRRGWLDRWQRPASIKGRLALLYALLTLGVLLTAIMVLYWAVVVSLAHDDQRFLGEKIHVLRTMLSERPNDQDLLREEVDWETRVIGHARYFVQILNQQGHVVIQTPGLDTSGIDQSAFPTPIPVAATDPRMRWVDAANGRRYLLSAARARFGEGGPPHIVRLAVDVSHEDRILGDFRHIAELVLLAGVLLSGLLGALIAHYGLRPLASLARAVEETTALRLDQRIVAAAWPREFVPLANAFNRLLQHLEGAFARLSGYAADLAHELRTPINNLMGETEVTLARPRAVEDYEQTLISNLEEYQRLARMIDSLLFLARAENALVTNDKTLFDAGDAATEVAEFYRPVADEAGIAMACAGQAKLLADRDLFRRALSNLVDNAIRHSLDGGRVQVSVARYDHGAIHVEVADSGRGIAATEQAQVFDRFFRGADSRAASGGSGLGLAIVKSIMWLHGGEVRLASEPGQGTTVTLVFPPDETIE